MVFLYSFSYRAIPCGCPELQFLVLDGVCNFVRNVFSHSIFFKEGKSDFACCKPAPANIPRKAVHKWQRLFHPPAQLEAKYVVNERQNLFPVRCFFRHNVSKSDNVEHKAHGH